MIDVVLSRALMGTHSECYFGRTQYPSPALLDHLGFEQGFGGHQVDAVILLIFLSDEPAGSHLPFSSVEISLM